MQSTPIQSAISWLLVFGTLHLLGACPCGCLEHNGWYQVAASLLGSDLESEDFAGNESPIGHEEDCDELHSSTYFLAETQRVTVPNGPLLLSGLLDESAKLGERLVADQGSRQHTSSDSLSGLLLRTRLQILRL